jgi:hypothetical protein
MFFKSNSSFLYSAGAAIVYNIPLNAFKNYSREYHLIYQDAAACVTATFSSEYFPF